MSPPPKISEKSSSLDLWQFKIHEHLPNFTKETLIRYVIVYLL